MSGARSITKGLALYPSRTVNETRRLARMAEDFGYTHLWFGDSQNIWREAYVSMAATALDTSGITIGTGVTNGVTRHPSVIASAWATLYELSAGRVAAGFGVGDSALHTMGAEPMKVTDLDRLVGDLRALWRLETAQAGETDSTYRLAYLPTAINVPVYIAASGPRLLRLAGRVADGVILLVGTNPDSVRSAINTIHESATSARRDPQEIDIVLWAPMALDEDAMVARDRVRAHVSRTVLRPIRVELSQDEMETVDAIRKQYNYYDHMVPHSEHSKLVPDTLVDRFALAGRHEEVRNRISHLEELGVSQIGAIPFGETDSEIDDVIRDFAML